MKKKYKHLNLEEREEISLLIVQGASLGHIAMHLGRNKSTISREISKNGAPINKGYYRAHKAQERAVIRNQESHRKPRLKNKKIRDYVVKKLKEGLSPELISGRILRDIKGQQICCETIYQYIYTESPHLIQHLIRKHKRRKAKGQGHKHVKSHIPQRISINKRSAEINKRKRFGDWEADTIVSSQSKEAACVLVERKSRKLILKKLCRKTARKMMLTTARALVNLPEKLRRSITYDNGSENTKHMETNKLLGTKSYFCEPYHSWEKGSVENVIGIIRRYFPKKTDFSKISYTEFNRVELIINNRPKKCLNYLTPNEVFAKCCT